MQVRADEADGTPTARLDVEWTRDGSGVPVKRVAPRLSTPGPVSGSADGSVVSQVVREKVGAAGTYAWVKFSSSTLLAKSDAGMWLMLLNAADLALLETWAVDPTMTMLGHISWTAIVILLSAMIVPSTPRRTLVASLVAAAMGPIGMGIAHLFGRAVPPLVRALGLGARRPCGPPV